MRHGSRWEHNSNAVLSVRCRREDLPVPMTLQSVAELCEAASAPDTIDTCPLCGVVRGREYEHVCESMPDPSSPFGDAMSQPANRVPVRLEWTYPIGPLRVMTEEGTAAVSGMLRCDDNGFYLER